MTAISTHTEVWERYFDTEEKPTEPVLEIFEASCALLDDTQFDNSTINRFNTALKNAGNKGENEVEKEAVKGGISTLIHRLLEKENLREKLKDSSHTVHVLPALLRQLEVETPDWKNAFEAVFRYCLNTPAPILYRQIEYHNVEFLDPEVKKSLCVIKASPESDDQIKWMYECTAEYCQSEPGGEEPKVQRKRDQLSLTYRRFFKREKQ